MSTLQSSEKATEHIDTIATPPEQTGAPALEPEPEPESDEIVETSSCDACLDQIIALYTTMDVDPGHVESLAAQAQEEGYCPFELRDPNRIVCVASCAIRAIATACPQIADLQATGQITPH